MDGPRDYHTKSVSQKRKINIIWYHIYVESKIRHRGTYLQKRNRCSDIESKLMFAKGKRLGEEKDGEFAISRCKLLCKGWIAKAI